MEIYTPREDSYLLKSSFGDYLRDNLKKNKINKKIRILDMGTGSGIQILSAKKLGFVNLFASDINKKSFFYLKNKGIKFFHSNLFENIPKNNKFDLILFNPPYLPYEKHEPKESRLQTTGGKKGYEIIFNFLIQSKKYLKNDSVILLLFSSLSKRSVILKNARKMNYKTRVFSILKLPFETLYVYILKNNYP